jgi:hypothetical protein
MAVVDHKMVQEAGYPIHISPHVGKHISQVKLGKATTTPRTILGASHLSAQELGRTPEKPYPISMNQCFRSRAPLSM